MRDDRRIEPLPEIIAPGVWDVGHLSRGGHASRGSLVYRAPLDPTPFARGVRIHEYAHVRFSPDHPEHAKHGVALLTLLAVEDARVNECAARAGLAHALLQVDDPAIVPPSPAASLRHATLLVVAAHRTGAATRVRAAMREWGDAGRLVLRLADRALAPLRAPGRFPDFDRTVAIARRLDEAFGVGPDEDPPERGATSCGLHVIVGEGHEGRLRVPGVGDLVRPEPGSVAWGRLRRIEEPVRSVAVAPPGRMLPRHRSTDEGTLLRAPHRWTTDRRIFASTLRRPGGSVLIDASGSMSLAPDDLLKIVAAAAGAQVACYNGTAEGWGAIRILARGGRRVPDRLVGPPVDASGNVIDGPALRWLATKPGPRIWVSDGGVTGTGDLQTRELRAEAQRICRGAGIRRVDDVDAAVALLRARHAGRRDPAPSPPKGDRKRSRA